MVIVLLKNQIHKSIKVSYTHINTNKIVFSYVYVDHQTKRNSINT